MQLNTFLSRVYGEPIGFTILKIFVIDRNTILTVRHSECIFCTVDANRTLISGAFEGTVRYARLALTKLYYESKTEELQFRPQLHRNAQSCVLNFEIVLSVLFYT